MPFFDRRHVVLPPEVAKLLPKNRLLSEVIQIQSPPGLLDSFVFSPFFFSKSVGRDGSSGTDLANGWFCGWNRSERVASDRRAAEPGLGALRDPPPGAAHHALPEAPQLPAAAGEPGRHRRRRPDDTQVKTKSPHPLPFLGSLLLFLRIYSSSYFPSHFFPSVARLLFVEMLISVTATVD